MTALNPKWLDAAAAGLVAGRARGALPLEELFGSAAEGLALDALALAGQARRFMRPAPPASFDATVAVEDGRAIVSNEARGLMLRLLSGKGADPQEAPARAVAFALQAKKLRPHPFDLPRLDAFARAHADLLGAAALAFATPRGEEARSFFEADAVDESNWRTVAPSQQAGFIARLRAREPEKARELVVAAFPSCKAEARARLLEALAAGLSEADKPFLESLAGDRAPKVKELATRLLAALPGSEAGQKLLADFASRVKISKAGLLSRRSVVKLEPPANVAGAYVDLWAATATSPLPLDGLAAHFSLSVEALCSAAQEDEALSKAFAICALREGRAELLASSMRAAPGAWIFVAQQAIERGYEQAARQFNWPIHTETALAFEPAEAAALCAALLQPELWDEAPHAHAFRPIQTLLGGPLPPSVAGRLLGSKFWRALVAGEEPDAALLACLSALTPKELRSRMRADLANAPAAQAARALLALDCLDSLDAP